MPAEVQAAWNHNLLCTFVYRISNSLADGVWDFSIGATYIYFLSGRSNKAVGLVEGVCGLCLALAAFPAGWLADHLRRDAVLKAAGVVSALATAVTSTALYITDFRIHVFSADLGARFLLLAVSFGLWGATFGMGSSVVEAIFADSTPTGSRSQIYSMLYSICGAATAIGPVIAVVLFLVMAVDMVLSIIPTCTLFMFDDDKALKHESDAHQTLPPDADAAVDMEAVEEGAKRLLAAQRRCGMSLQWIPAIISISDLIYGLGNGMTVKLLPVFFAEEVGLSPIAVNLTMAAMPVALAICTLVAGQMAHHVGRVLAVQSFKLLAVILMWLMAWPGLWRHPSVLVPIYLLRTAAANCSYPLNKSILMDFCPKETRARWNSLEAIISFGWSGSAILGGLLVDAYGFDLTFVITGMMQFMGWLVLCLLFPLVPRTEGPVAAAKVMLKDAPEQEPLLAELEHQLSIASVTCHLTLTPGTLSKVPSLDAKMLAGLQSTLTSPTAPGFTNVAPQ